MRDYLYIWHNAEEKYIVTSGIHFKDYKVILEQQNGIFILKGENCVAASKDYADTNLEFVVKEWFIELEKEIKNKWGDFAWVDYNTNKWPLQVPDKELCEMLYFGLKHKPMKKVFMPSLKNKFLAYSHDDGWYLQLYYVNWKSIENLLQAVVIPKFGNLDSKALKIGTHAYSLYDGKVVIEEKSHDIDKIYNQRFYKNKLEKVVQRKK